MQKSNHNFVYFLSSIMPMMSYAGNLSVPEPQGQVMPAQQPKVDTTEQAFPFALNDDVFPKLDSSSDSSQPLQQAPQVQQVSPVQQVSQAQQPAQKVIPADAKILNVAPNMTAPSAPAQEHPKAEPTPVQAQFPHTASVPVPEVSTSTQPVQGALFNHDVSNEKKAAIEHGVEHHTAPMPTREPMPITHDAQVPQQEKNHAQEAAAQSPQEQALSIDTMNVSAPSGNWLLKRIWWEKAESLFDQIRAKVLQALSFTHEYEKKRSELERTVLDPFYLHIGMGQGELTAIISYLIEEIARLQEREGSLTPAEREFFTVIAGHQKLLEKLSLDAQSVARIDIELDEAMDKLRDRNDICRRYEQQAWEYFRTIAKELSEKKARELYYVMESLEKSVEDELGWVSTQFAHYFEQQKQHVQQQVAYIQKTLKDLKEKGLDFKKQAQRMEEAALQRNQEKQHQKIQEAVAEVEQNAGFFESIKRAWSKFVSNVVWVWDSFIGLFTSSDQVEVVAHRPEKKRDEAHSEPFVQKKSAPISQESTTHLPLAPQPPHLPETVSTSISFDAQQSAASDQALDIVEMADIPEEHVTEIVQA